MVWRMTFYVILWTARNVVVFNGSNLEVQQIIDIVGFKVAYWCKAKWTNGAISIDDFIRVSECIQIDSVGGKKRPHLDWFTPNNGQLKFNVDGTTKWQPGEAGIGGILRDESGSTKVVFSKPIGLADSNLAELLAIKEAFLIFAASNWADEKELIVESDLKIALKWVNDPCLGPWRFRQILFQIEGYKKKIIRWFVKHIFKEINSIADCLAKSSIDRGSPITCSFD
ncbi:hypothetical protein CCACVL1_18294 [Corchorus capsularis]|uniref:RNase H type-1 domain-containing protein n=1 Tax=Corchorus capsularis TaxID=210143 RepID=A0A1R3HLK3_COCAP|nr:hypothetical protein CCACVL1_18294 [Corchorus capsularis]